MRKTALLVIAIAVPAAGILATASAQGQRGGGGGPRQAPVVYRDFDARSARNVNVRPKQAQENEVRSLQAGATWDPAQGNPASVVRTRGYLTQASSQGAGAIARGFLKSHKALYGLSDAEIAAADGSSYPTKHNGVTHVALQQKDGGRDVFGAIALFTIDKSGRLAGQSGVLAADAKAAEPARLTAADALRAAADSVGTSSTGQITIRSAGAAPTRRTVFDNSFAPSLAKPNPAIAELVTFPMPSGQADRAAWRVTLEVNDTAFYELVVDAVNGDVLYRHNSVRNVAQGNVFTTQNPLPTNSQVIVNFPAGWITDRLLEGNNSNTYEDRDANNAIDTYRPQSAPSGDPANYQHFNYTFTNSYESTGGTDAGLNTDRDASATQLHYWVNFAHDYLYTLGFNEASRNFQTNNFGLGGAGNDAVLAEAFNGWGTGTELLCPDGDPPVPNTKLCRNNANFNTPPDGTAPRLQVYLGAAPLPVRESEMEGDTIVHEYGHGVSNRLVGNGTMGSGAQTDGMGEGWGDFLATSIFNDPVIFEYSGRANPAGGVSGFRRIASYATSTLKYSNVCFTDLAGTVAGCEVHNDGEVWATALWAMRAALITKYGSTAAGKAQAEQLVIDGMKSTPTNATFLSARDGILTADQTNNAGANACLIWGVFAAREMGVNAATAADQKTVTADTTGPATCQPTADAGGPYTTPEGTDVTLTAAASTTPTGTGPLTYEWDLDNDGAYDDATGVSPSFTSVGDDGGPFTVGVKVTNTAGFTATDTATVTVTSVAPTVGTINNNAPKPEGSLVTVNGVITDPGWLDPLTATINWGDGSGTVALSGSVENARPNASLTYSGVTHAYGTDGAYTITICANDDKPAPVCNTVNVTITNVPPTVPAIVTNGPKPENSAVTVSSGVITDPGWLDPLTATISWGDGTPAVNLPGTLENNPPDATYTWNAINHTYGDDGTFTIRICAADDDTTNNCNTTSVTITNVNPTATINETGTVNVNGTPVFFAHIGVPIAFKGNATDPGSDDLTLRWNWDDGGAAIDASLTSLNNPAINPDPDPSPTINPRNVNFNQSHAFGLACAYDVEFSALDDDGGSALDSVKVIITGNPANHDKSAGFWAHEYQDSSGDEISPITLSCYLEITGFLSQVFNEARNAATFAAAHSVLDDGPNSARDRLDRVLLTNWLNFANGAFEFTQLMDTNANGSPDTQFGVAMKNAETVRLNPASTTAQIDAQRKILQSFDS